MGWQRGLCRPSTPHSTTGVSPSELMFGRQLGTSGDVYALVRNSKGKEHDAHVQLREFTVGARVFVRNFGRGPMWLPVVVKELTGPVSYTVELEDDRVVHRYVDHVRGRTSPDRMPPRAGTPVEFPTPVPDPPDSPESPVGDSAVLRRSSHQHQAPERFGIPVHDT